MKTRHRRAFTQIDLLVLIGIGAVLLALLPGCIGQTGHRRASHRSFCKNNLKQIGLALHNYEISYKTYPPGFVRAGGELLLSGSGDRLTVGNPPDSAYGWLAYLLPEMDQAPLFRKMFPHPSVSFGSESTIPLAATVMTALHCPSDPGPAQLGDDPLLSGGLQHQGTTSYVGNFGVGLPTPNVYRSGDYSDVDMQAKHVQGMFGENSHIRVQDVRDGLSNVIFAAERRLLRDCNLDFSTSPVQGRLCSVWAGVSGPGGRGGMSKIGALVFTGSTGDPTQLAKTGDLLGATSGGVNRPGESAPAVLAINHLATAMNGSLMIEDSNADWNTIGISSWHEGGAQVALGDGTVRFFSDKMDHNVFLNLCRKADGQTIGEF